MWSGGFVWKHFKNNTLCCGDSFQAASSHYECELWGRQDWPQCGVRLRLFNLSSTPWRLPPSQLSSLHTLLHLLPFSSGTAQQQQYALKRGEAHCYSWLSVSCAVTLGPGSDCTHTHAHTHAHTQALYQREDMVEFLFVRNQIKSI